MNRICIQEVLRWLKEDGRRKNVRIRAFVAVRILREIYLEF